MEKLKQDEERKEPPTPRRRHLPYRLTPTATLGAITVPPQPLTPPAGLATLSEV